MRESRTPKKKKNSTAQGHAAPSGAILFDGCWDACQNKVRKTHSNHFADGQHRAQPSNKSCDNVSSEPLLIADSSCFAMHHTIFMGKLWRLLFLLLHRLRHDKYGYRSPPASDCRRLHISYMAWMDCYSCRNRRKNTTEVETIKSIDKWLYRAYYDRWRNFRHQCGHAMQNQCKCFGKYTSLPFLSWLDVWVAMNSHVHR